MTGAAFSFIGPDTRVLAIGTRVMQNRSRVEASRRKWLDYRGYGQAHIAEAYRKGYERDRDERGTVVAILDGPYCLGYEVAWERDYTAPPSQCMASYIEPADD